MKVALLADYPGFIPELADWYRLEWEPYYGSDGPGDARADLMSRCNRMQLPVGLVAVEGAQVSGAVALDLDVATNLSPSIVGLLVRKESRGRGITTSLLGATEELAKQLGYSRLYISTTALDELLIQTGWRRTVPVEFHNDERGSIYARDL